MSLKIGVHRYFKSTQFKSDIIKLILYNLYFLFVLLFTTVSIEAQQYGTLRGFVRDSLSAEVLPFCNVLISEINTGASTDINGFFHIPSIPANNEYTVLISYVGYKTETLKIKISSNKTTEIHVLLKPVNIRLQEVVKEAESVKTPNEIDLGAQHFTIKEVEMIPKGLESDIMRSLKTLPGVKTTSDISGRYFVRGGESDQNLVLFNGATIFNPFHALGIFSIVDPQIIKAVQFYRGGFPVQYDGRLSSVMQIKTKDGNKNQFGGSAGAGLLSGKVLVEGPIPKGSFILTGRKSYYSDALNPFLNDKQIPYNFYDVNLKINYADPFNLKNSQFSIFALLSKDDILYNDASKADYKFQNNIIGVDYYQVYDVPLFSQIAFTTSQYNAEIIPNESGVRVQKNFVKEFTWQTNFTYLFNSRDELGAGLLIRTLKPEFEFENQKGKRIYYEDVGANFDFYLKYSFLRIKNLGLEGGIRFSPVSMVSKPGPIVVPRFNLTYRPFSKLAVKAGVGLFKQELLAFTDDAEVVSIFEPYLIIPEGLETSTSVHYMAGLEYNFTSNLSLLIEAYYKSLRNLVDINQNKISVYDPDFISTDGESYGIEYLAKYQDEDYYLSAAYTLSWAYKGIEKERYYPRYDTRHTVDLIAAVNIGSGWEVSILWTLNSGLPFTQSIGYFEKLQIDDLWEQWLVLGLTNPYLLLGERNAHRLPVYHKLDISITKKLHLGFMDLTVDLSALNVYDRKNIFYFDRKTGERVNMLPFLPSASIKIDL